MSEAPLSLERAGGAAWCTLDRPPLNLLEPGLIDAVRATFDALAADRVTRVAILTGGGRAFTAGMDVRVLRDLDTARAKDLITALHGAIDAVHQAPFPVIAAVNGPCLGAGFELALACDRSEEHTSELHSPFLISYAVFCLKKKKNNKDRGAAIEFRKNKIKEKIK